METFKKPESFADIKAPTSPVICCLVDAVHTVCPAKWSHIHEEFPRNELEIDVLTLLVLILTRDTVKDDPIEQFAIVGFSVV